MRLSGRVVIRGDGSAAEDKLTLRASAPICNGSGRVSLNMHPAFRPDLSVDKNGLSHNMRVGNMSDLSVIDNVDVELSKSANLLGRDCNVNAQWTNANRNPAAKVAISTNVDNIGDVTVTLGKKGNTSVLEENRPLERDMVRVSADLPVSDLTGQKDLTARLEYDLGNDEATLHLAYSSGDVGAKVRSRYNAGSGKMSHRLSLNYNGIEGVKVSGDVNDAVEGKVCVNKDQYELRVPVSKSGVNVNDVQVRYNWSHDM